MGERTDADENEPATGNGLTIGKVTMSLSVGYYELSFSESM